VFNGCSTEGSGANSTHLKRRKASKIFSAWSSQGKGGEKGVKLEKRGNGGPSKGMGTGRRKRNAPLGVARWKGPRSKMSKRPQQKAKGKGRATNDRWGKLGSFFQSLQSAALFLKDKKQRGRRRRTEGVVPLKECEGGGRPKQLGPTSGSKKLET